MAKTTRKEAAKELAKAQGKGMLDSAKAVGGAAKDFITGGPVAAVKTAVKSIPTLVKDNINLFKNLFKVIFNDSAIYGGNHAIPVNCDRSTGMHYYPTLAENSTMGFIPKLSELHVKMMQFVDSTSFNENVSSLYEAIRYAMRSNVTYSKDQLKAFIINNISLYALCKHYEKRLGFLKYEDPQYDEFRELWRTEEIAGTGYNFIQHLTKNPDFDSETNLAHALDVYEDLVTSSFRFILPTNMKEWIDRYVGSLFVLDDDVANPKYMHIVLENLPFYSDLDFTKYQELTTNGLTISYLYNLIDAFRNDSTASMIRADIIKVPTQVNSRVASGLFVSEGWLTPYSVFKPTPVIDPTMKQALINAYTSASAVSEDGYVRLDFLPNNKGDNLTSLLFMGATYNSVSQTSVYNISAMEALKLVVKVYASPSNIVKLPDGFLQTGQALLNESFAISITTDVSSDVYINAETTSQGRRYYEPGLTSAMGTNLVCDLAVDPYKVTWYDLDNGGLHPRIAIPVALNSSGYGLFLITSDFFESFYESKEFTSAVGLPLYAFVPASMDANPILRKALNDKVPVVISQEIFNLAISGASGYNCGRVGRVGMVRNGWLWSVNIELTTVQVTAGPFDTPSDISWVTDIRFPNADIGNEYIDGATITVDNQIIQPGYIYYPQWVFMALGYCIPIVNKLRVHTSINNNTRTVTLGKSLMKEDYIPAFINVNDIPAVMSRMIKGLTKLSK